MTQEQAMAEEPNFEELKAEKSEKAEKTEKTEPSAMKDIEFLLDIPLELTVQLGKTRMLIKDLLQLGQGSVVELEKLAGEPMEILVNNKLVARGEVVVVNEKFGVRLTDILSPTERIKQLK
jgi:flagellar motor switch protein FliN/FliY